MGFGEAQNIDLEVFKFALGMLAKMLGLRYMSLNLVKRGLSSDVEHVMPYGILKAYR